MVLYIPKVYRHKVMISVDRYNAAQEWTFRNVPECYYASTEDENGKVFLIYSFSSAQDATIFKLKFA